MTSDGSPAPDAERAPSSAARSGRRPGSPDTRDAILRAARARFADVGFERASVRSIAKSAGVDSALVHHYFGTKKNLLAKAMAIPVDPETVLSQIRAVPDDRLAEAILRAVVGLWDSPKGASVIAAFRSVLGGSDTQLIRTFLLEVALKEVRGRVDVPAGSAQTRVSLAASHMLGILVARKMLGIEPIASMPLDELVTHCTPAIQNYLTGEFEWP